ncbi:unnamed protein product [Cylicocyclus nassatus]|uniref:SCP domain-containing protein n=1 Tax=Cylicocyclus nassatus TaxID=53992 RepID=A0AA36HH14_CYLNA|nr:unnamed protein product [Cylicocyclus nassatus]
MLWLICLVLIISKPVSAGGATFCKNGNISEDDVSQTLALINSRRTVLASGLQLNISDGDDGPVLGLDPPARNMRKMTYDCAVEQKARDLLATMSCDELYNGETEVGKIDLERGFFFSGYESIQIILRLYLNSLFDWAVLASNSSVKYKYRHWGFSNINGNLMRADASKLGCASRECRENNDFPYNHYLCMTDQRNIKDGEELYKVGAAKAECDPLIQAEFPGSSSGYASDGAE